MNASTSIAIIVDTLHGGGAEKVCILLAKTLQKMRVDVHLIVVKPLCEYELEADIPLHFLLDDASARLHKKRYQNRATLALKQLVEDVGGFHLVLSNLDGAHAIVHAANLPNTWYVVHNSIDEKLRRARRLGPIKYFRQKAVYRFFNNQNLVAVSKGLQDELLAGKHIQARNVRLIYNPVDEDAIHENLKRDTPTLSEPYILHVGRFARLKRHDTLLQAYKCLVTRFERKVKLVLLCEASRKLKKLIKKYALEEHIVLPGFQQNPYIWMKNAEALVLSSEGEGFGLVLVEAMLCGTPVVSTDCQHGPAEILNGNLAEYLSPVGDPDTLAENINKVLARKPSMTHAGILPKVKPEYSASQYLALLDVDAH